jgi:hypothetical protein
MTISQKQECEQVALLPCPQCGSPDIRWISGGAGNHFLNCKECLLATDDGSKERVAKRWNDRPTTVPNHVADGLAEALGNAMNPPIVERLRVYSDFLNGSSQMDDIWLGDQPPSKRGAFWWRNDLPLTDAADTITDLLAASEKATQWMNDPRMGQWPYVEGPHFFADKTRICGELEDAIARAKGGAA